MFQSKWFDDASLQARTLIGSNDFRSILDGHLAEEFLGISYELRTTSEQKGRATGSFAPAPSW